MSLLIHFKLFCSIGKNSTGKKINNNKKTHRTENYSTPTIQAKKKKTDGKIKS